MERERRLRRRADFEAATRRGRSFAHPLLILRLIPNHSAQTRWGFAVSKRIGNAVTRNRVRRRLREIGRTAPVRLGFDIVAIARREAAEARFDELRRALVELLTRAKAIEPEGDGGEAIAR